MDAASQDWALAHLSHHMKEKQQPYRRLHQRSALMLTAAANDDLNVVSGERSKVRVAPCGQGISAGEIAGCGSRVSEDRMDGGSIE